LITSRLKIRDVAVVQKRVQCKALVKIISKPSGSIKGREFD
jgi:hypothetical protein